MAVLVSVRSNNTEMGKYVDSFWGIEQTAICPGEKTGGCLFALGPSLENACAGYSLESLGDKMVFLEYVDTVGAEVIYDYMPKRKDADRGRISVDMNTRERKLIKMSKDEPSSWYRCHAWDGVCEMISSNDLKKSVCIAWC